MVLKRTTVINYEERATHKHTAIRIPIRNLKLVRGCSVGTVRYDVEERM